jgi:hypothetical protein
VLLSVLDPALLVYKFEDWQNREIHCFQRFGALSLHRRILKEYGQKMALSHSLAAQILEHFPWNANLRGIKELHDLRHFFFVDLQKAEYVDTNTNGEVQLQPPGIVCLYVDTPEIIDSWKSLLCECIDRAHEPDLDPQIATWETDSIRELPEPFALKVITFDPNGDDQICDFPLIWDMYTWAQRLITQNWWPDLHKSIDLTFKTNLGLMQHPMARNQPTPFTVTDSFMKSLDRYCQAQPLRNALIEAITKRVYGIFDESLGDEPFGDKRRFRVTGFWRVHYHEEHDEIVLEEFGPHSMGGVN